MVPKLLGRDLEWLLLKGDHGLYIDLKQWCQHWKNIRHKCGDGGSLLPHLLEIHCDKLVETF